MTGRPRIAVLAAPVKPPASVADPDRYRDLRGRLIAWFTTRSVGYLAEELADQTIERCLRAERRGQRVKDSYVFYAARSVEIDELRSRWYRDVPIDGQYPMTTRFDAPEALELLAGLTALERRLVVLKAAGYYRRELMASEGLGRDQIRNRVDRLRDKLRRRGEV